ncbi:hypothetical protein HBN50_02935 [Halobacteriovorax sp. GB3]|uniref:hypothetical protein n=1 Tax=Halobacteriovorax sp. GB3 TaxID=2719615 RepID=UPI0023627590|nr:hypothetical protein [Halobacteriovorax sp. GB3]MDD0852030.1 hypothetical protein [Halobacteriovorax sp. GB3]
MRKVSIFALTLATLFSLSFLSVDNSYFRKPAQITDFSSYHQVDGGSIENIPNNSVVEGSLAYDGMQPNYIIDLDTPLLKQYLNEAKLIGEEESDFWTKISKISDLVSKKALRERDYDSPSYINLTRYYKDSELDIPLSEYIDCSVGVCREHALLIHLLLNSAGIKNKHTYAEIRRVNNAEDYNIVENHGFVTVEHKGKTWVVDSYYKGFNGYLLNDLLSENGITIQSEKAPIAKELIDFRRIIKIHDYPKVWIPKNNEGCLELMDNFHKS